jgi:hypothetical protein
MINVVIWGVNLVLKEYLIYSSLENGELIYQSVGYGDSSREKIVNILNKELSS